MRVALVHDWLTGMRGGEKVLEELCVMYPSADIFTLVYLPEKISPVIRAHRVRPSLLQRMPLVDRYYRYYLPAMPLVIERFKLDEYDLVISSSHCVAKGIHPGSKATHVCYCHTPMRYIWDMYDDYFGKAGWIKKYGMLLFRSYLRKWDVNTAGRVDFFLANSETVRERIKRLYNREAAVINPPVNIDFFTYDEHIRREDYFLYVGAFAPYKRVDVVIDAFNRIGKKLVVIGDGEIFHEIRMRARENITFLGWVDDATLRSCYACARAVVFPSNEDFGIVPVESMACGTPVIAYNKGGGTETVVQGKTGLLFDEQNVDSLAAALDIFEKINFDRAILRKHAEKYSKKNFRESFQRYINEILPKRHAAKSLPVN